MIFALIYWKDKFWILMISIVAYCKAGFKWDREVLVLIFIGLEIL